MRFRVIVHTAEEGGFWAEVPALAGCVSQGETVNEVLDNLREAAAGWLEAAEELSTLGPESQLAEIEV